MHMFGSIFFCQAPDYRVYKPKSIPGVNIISRPSIYRFSTFSKCLWGFKSLIRRKQVDSIQEKARDSRLAKELSVLHLTAIGVGSTIGAGVYILVGTVAREHSGPALALSFLISGIAAALSAFCYAELASRCPSAGSAYHYSYICVGEVAAWLIGWALILEYTIGGSAVARGVSPNLALFFGANHNLPAILGRQYIPWLDVVVDPFAAVLVFVVTGLLCLGIKESTLAQGIATTINVCAMIFVIIVGAYLGFRTGWTGYKLPSGFFPFGIDGMFAGSATVFFAYVGFDSVVSTAEEVRNPQRDLPLGIGAAFLVCCTLYMLVSCIVVGLVPYYAMDPDTPISAAFASHGMHWAAHLIAAGTITALCSTLMGSLLPQPRILMAMSRDGLLPQLFSHIDQKTQVPVRSTIVSGVGAATLAFFMDVPQLAGMVSVGTLLAFTMAAVSILILRYVPPNEVPVPSSLQETIESVSLRYNSSGIGGIDVQKDGKSHAGTSFYCKMLPSKEEMCDKVPLVASHMDQGIFVVSEKSRRLLAGWTIFFTFMGVLVLASAASALGLSRYVRFGLCGIGGAVLLSGLAVLTCIDQDVARHKFGHAGGFLCPFVPLLPIVCILVNVYLLINLGISTWIRVLVWLAIGVVVYALYGQNHSLLQHAVYVPTMHAEEIYSSSMDSKA